MTGKKSVIGKSRRALVKAFDAAVEDHRAGRLDRAEAGYRKVLQVAPNDVSALSNLGSLCRQKGHIERAIWLLQKAGELSPADPTVSKNLANALFDHGDFAQAIEQYAKVDAAGLLNADICWRMSFAWSACGSLDKSVNWAERAFSLSSRGVHDRVLLAWKLLEAKRTDEARDLLQDAAAMAPEDERVACFLAIARGENPVHGHPDIVRLSYDGAAVFYDRSVVPALQNTTPVALERLIDEACGTGRHFARALDLACGTGLMGQRVRPRVGELVGIDLSDRMIDEARKKKVYDRLAAADIAEFLHREQARYDLILCSDAFIHVGDLAPVFAGVARCLTGGGSFVFSTEHMHSDRFEFDASTFRFRHGDGYVTDAVRAAGLSLACHQQATIRVNFGVPVTGGLYAATLEA